jgi:hypothetical protein
MKTFRSALILLAIEYIVMKLIDFAEGYTEANADKVEDAVKKMIPGTDFDEIGWNLVKPAMPKMFEIARTLAEKIHNDPTVDPLQLHAMIIEEMNKTDFSEVAA